MFFILSKLAGFLIEPLVWLVGLGVAAVWYRNKPRGRRLLIWAVGLMVFFSNDFISNQVMQAWNQKPVRLDSLHGPYDYVIVLGGFTIQDQQPTDRVYLNQAADRLMHSLLLYRKGIVKKIILSGGRGSLASYTHQTEAHNAAIELALCQMPPEDILTEPNSRNTYENAIFSLKMMREDGHPNPKVLVVTSAFHARRARLCFQKAGLDAPVFVTDLRTHPTSFALDVLFVPTVDALSRWNVLCHEWAGLFVYWVAGYI